MQTGALKEMSLTGPVRPGPGPNKELYMCIYKYIYVYMKCLVFGSCPHPCHQVSLSRPYVTDLENLRWCLNFQHHLQVFFQIENIRILLLVLESWCSVVGTLKLVHSLWCSKVGAQILVVYSWYAAVGIQNWYGAAGILMFLTILVFAS